MQKPPLDPDVAETAPSDSAFTVYDEEHIITYLRLLDADAKGADWREVARIVLHLDPAQESDRARRAFESHLSRAKMDDGARLPTLATRWRVGLGRLSTSFSFQGGRCLSYKCEVRRRPLSAIGLFGHGVMSDLSP
jgi:hypothetical protein